MTTLSLPETIARYGLNAKKSFGQHFLLDENITDKIARAAGDLSPGTTIEIGPGPGGLTRSLLKAGATVLAVEIDTRCIAALKELEEAYPGKLTVLQADALKTDLLAITAPPRRIVANLPYNVGTPLLVKWLHEIYLCFPSKGERQSASGSDARCVGVTGDSTYSEYEITSLPGAPTPTLPPLGGGSYESLTLMFQKEVAERIVAEPNTKDYGRLSVLCQFLCEAQPLFDLPPGAFSPPPKVTSTVIRLIPHKQPVADILLKNLERVTASAFGQRRKMLRQSLKAATVCPEALLERAAIDGTRRAETLSVEEFCRLAASFTLS